MGSRPCGTLALLVSVLVAGCDDDLPTGPFAPEPCLSDPVFQTEVVSHVSHDVMKVGLLDAASRMTVAFPQSEDTEELAQLIESLNEPGPIPLDLACRTVSLSRHFLALQPDDPATQPDRVAITLVLDFTDTFIANLQ